ncbi:MAG: S-adenosylmethionine:tRNA ribosyltransferase-isomerase [Cyclobacteriaceae bacterium]|nr:S-adenosylmethionine:tRNA ribosyltransferase-isomerase [Cyclobacteriaceae bacterium]
MNDSLVTSYIYELPEERIALEPAQPRDHSKLLAYRSGQVSHHRFTELPGLIPTDATLFFNDTRVVPARIHFRKPTGAVIEIFILQPVAPHTIIPLAMAAVGTCQWKCAIGNLKRWNGEPLVLTLVDGTLTVTLINREEQVVAFSWTPEDLSFAQILKQAGEVPLPPYIHRSLRPSDTADYQTVYSRHDGAVAAPTAGLHFTDAVLNELETRGIKKDFLTLHVSAGTFMPMKSERIEDHRMHEEQVIVTRHNLNMLLRSDRPIPVGTTSMRTLESIYWYGVQLLNDPAAPFHVSQDLPYGNLTADREKAIARVLQFLDDHDRNFIAGTTAIFIRPGYRFRVCKGLITNFHQPGSTLLVLIAALLGDDWRRVYESALHERYRFLSFGDSSLLLP